MLGTILPGLVPLAVRLAEAWARKRGEAPDAMVPPGDEREDRALRVLTSLVPFVDDALLGDRLNDAQEVGLRTMLVGAVAFRNASEGHDWGAKEEASIKELLREMVDLALGGETITVDVTDQLEVLAEAAAGPTA